MKYGICSLAGINRRELSEMINCSSVGVMGREELSEKRKRICSLARVITRKELLLRRYRVCSIMEGMIRKELR